MHCNNCWYENTRVSDSRTSDNGRMIRRRRYCEKCGNRFTTYEKLDVFNIVVEKSGNRRERYDREKLEDSIIKATNKRNISLEQIGSIIDRLENIWSVHDKITSNIAFNYGSRAEIIDANEGVVLAGFIDEHLHGGGGFDFMDASKEAFREIRKIHCLSAQAPHLQEIRAFHLNLFFQAWIHLHKSCE